MTENEVAETRAAGTLSSERRLFLEAASAYFDAEIAAELFTLLNEIAILRYEEAANTGSLLLCRPGSFETKLSMHFETKFALRDVRGVRKMLQVSGPQLPLVCDGRQIHGFTIADRYPRDVLKVQFSPGCVWELTRSGEAIAKVDMGSIESRPAPLDQERFSETARAIFASVSTAELMNLWRLVSAAASQTRGTNVLITAHAAAEAERLADQCTRVIPVALTPRLMEHLTSIDGTVIIDPWGVCYAIGAILDGPVTIRGDRTRGGRYNSALMYVDRGLFPCLIVVVSQNGAVNLVYDPRLAEIKYRLAGPPKS